MVCNVKEDCPDVSDEASCDKECTDKEGLMKCEASDEDDDTRWTYCLKRKFFCDGNDNCGNGFDEIGCADMDCMDNFYCGEGGRTICTKANYVCDGYNDCGNGRDEQGCD